MNLDIPLLVHSHSDLSKFDFSFKDIYLYEIQSKEFEEYIRSIWPEGFDHNFNFIRHIVKEEIHYDHQKYYAIVKKDFRNGFNQQDIYNVHRLLLIIFPSDLQILHEIHFHEFEGAIQTGSMTSWNERISGEYPGEYLMYIDDDIEELNEFIKLAFDRLTASKFLDISVFHYLTAFDASHRHYQYISLCMALESVISGTTELLYRLKRTIAILLGNKPYNCNKIFNNLNKIYSLRSKIVHGSDYNHATMVSYLPYIRVLTSRVIVELLVYNFANPEELNDRITELGYGDKDKIKEGYKQYRLNIRTYLDANWQDIN